VTVRILQGDCRERMRELDDASVDSCVTDPPYHLTSIVKRFGREARSHLDVPAHKDQSKVKAPQYGRLSRGFMGQQWDGGDVAFQSETWAEVFRVLKPGAHLVAFSGTRTYHRMACAIEDAGFEIRDQLAWTYGSGFPKSHNQPGGWGTALKPAWEPICLARKPLQGTVAANIAKHGTGALNIDECRIDTGESTLRIKAGGRGQFPHEDDSWEPKTVQVGSDLGRWPANIIHDGSEEVLAEFPADAPSGGHISRRLSPKSNNVYGDLGCPKEERVGFPDSGSAARFFASFPIGGDEWEYARSVRSAKSAESQCGLCGTPIADGPAATLTLDSSNAASQAGLGSTGICESCIPILSRALSAGSLGNIDTTPTIPSCSKSNGSAAPATAPITKRESVGRVAGGSDPASATRFLYCPKATSEERGEGNNHPTVKPVDLMRWLCRLVTPKGGTVLDPFAGSGSTLIAADAEQFHAIGCELSADYAAIAERRVRDAAGMFAEVLAA